MKHPIHKATQAGLLALFAAVALTACGSGDDETTPTATPPVSAPPAGTPPAPAPAPATSTPFATPMNSTDTSEVGKVETYAFAEKSNEQTLGAVSFAAGAVTFATSLTGAQAFAGAALRLYAPNNTGTAPITPFNASSFGKLRIELKSSTDATLTIKLQPNPVAADGCTATAQALVNSTQSEVVIDLDSTSFPLPEYCNGAGSAVAAVKAGVFSVDVINSAVSAGAHDLSVGRVSFSN
ncbi:hypothetical protein [Rhizobacter sp. Root1221]|uniref:hypothetical protein n=1 Tax=Rhizobacter sp. Root1221 TaxID=1736433 RepID=UPI0006FC0AC3|nr:hypothetical protein [Rhizobacter sp. Root1221]KQV95188.1 hypothetical protein ASC87_25370 [Rhizobacter sp. Root1221]